MTERDPDAGEPRRDEAVERLVAAGDYVGAAAAAASGGDRRRAIQLLERVWRFAEAVPLALELGDHALAVRLALDARDLPRALAIARAIPGDETAALVAATEHLARRGHRHEAAALAARAGRLEEAALLYERAEAPLEAARLYERAGRWQEAGRLYERVARAGPTAIDAAEAQLALGRLLGRLGRHHEAARALQAAARHPPTAQAARRRLCGELLALGLPTAAEEIARRAQRDDPSLPASAEDLARLAQGDDGGEITPVPMPQRFRLVKALGAGSLGRVYEARDDLLGRTVAIKSLTVGAGASGPERQAFERFLREAAAAARLRHPNIVALYELDERAALMVLEHLPGGTLADALAVRGALSPASVRRLALELLSGLEAAHAAGIIHRDVKPANVLFDAAGNAKLGDFGAAHLLDFGQTQTGGFIGTLAYLSPEQITGGHIGVSADLYALGATLFEALVGRPPFPGPDFVGQHLAETPPAPSALRPGLAPEHDAVLLRALAKAPDERFPSARAMAEAVRGWPTDVVAAVPLGPTPAAPAPATDEQAPERRPFGRTARGALFVTRDPRVGRAVLVEELDSPLDEATGEQVRALAALGGPHVQRVLALDPAACTITYEWLEGDVYPAGELPAGERRIADQHGPAIESLGSGPVRVVRTEGGPVVIVAPALVDG